MKQYQVLYHVDHGYKVISTRSLDYNDYVMSGWGVAYEGNQRQCIEYMELVEDEIAA